MEVFLLIVLLVVLVIVTVVGHGIWLICEAVISGLTGSKKPSPPSISGSIVGSATRIATWQCETCSAEVRASWMFCGDCGTPKTADSQVRTLRDFAAMERQLENFWREEKIELDILQKLTKVISDERIRLTIPKSAPQAAPVTEARTETNEEPVVQIPSVVDDTEVSYATEPVPTFLSARHDAEPKEDLPPAPPPRPPRRSFSEVLNSFMEESNIRWGEIIGGLLIIGCSTALVVSLWSQISQIPVLKFLIFTTVTAVLFGIGMYTEHRWKLPTTSRGILTIATLLVPLNFLAIAAVSSGDTSGGLVLASELFAPAIFLCLVYFAGRVITPGCAHLLAGGVLGSSVGQLLVRHFATFDATPGLLVFLGAFPVAFYVVGVCLALRFVLKDRKIDATEVSTVFTILGTMSFATLLPFGLLLYKSGPLPMSMMYLAPLVTLLGVPMLATGLVLWKRIQDKTLVASRTTGTALGILGLMMALAGMILAWPNPASIIPAALLNFLILSILAVVLEIPAAHFLAAGCFGLAYLILFHVLAGHVEWQNLRVTSLVSTCLDISSGQSLIGAFGIFVVVSEWFQLRKRKHESYAYLTAACLTGVISLLTVSAFGPLAGNQLQAVWLTFLIYTLGSLWIAWRRQLSGFTWISTGLLLFTLASALAWNTDYSFPFQTALLINASICTVAAILSSRRSTLESISKPINYAALSCLVLAVLSMFQTNPWQVTSMQAERIFWIAGLLLFSLWLNRHQLLLVAFQIALTAGVILTVKATLQQFEWYTYLPHAFLRPAALQIQGTMLALLSLLWIGARLIVRRLEAHPIHGFWKLLDTQNSIDRVIPWVLLGAFVLLSIYGAVSGVNQEFALQGTRAVDWNIAGFPHSEAFGIGSWVVLGLLTIIMLANAWERRQRLYLFGAVVAVSCAVPLLAGRFESDLATATAWRFLAAIFFAVSSVLLWFREHIRAQLKLFGRTVSEADSEQSALVLRGLIILLTVVPILLFTLYPALRTVALAPVQLPQSGVFSLLDIVLSYVLPLIVVSLVAIGFSIRESSPGYSFIAGLLLNTAVTLAYLLSMVSATTPVDSLMIVRIIQLNVITCAAYGLFWLSLRQRWLTSLKARAVQAEMLLKTETWLALVLNLGVIFALIVESIFGEPGRATLAAGNWLGWFAFAISWVAFVLVQRSRNEHLPVTGLASILLSIVAVITFGFTGDHVLQLRVITIGTTVAAWLMFVASFLPQLLSIYSSTSLLRETFKLDDHWSRSAIVSSTAIGLVSCFLSLRLLAVFTVDQDVWWSIFPLIALCVLAAVSQWHTLRRAYLYAAGILLHVAVSIWWLAYAGFDEFSFTHFVESNLLVGSAAAILWLSLELRARRQKQNETMHELFSYHNLVVLASVFWLIALTWFRFVVGETHSSSLTWPSWIAVAMLMFATLWDRRAAYATAGLYTLGLIAAAIVFQRLHLPDDDQAWSLMMFLAVYALGTTLLWRKRATLIAAAERLRIVPRQDSSVPQLVWLSAASTVAVVLVALIAYWIDLRFVTLELRLSASLAVIAQAITLGFLAEGVWQIRWRRSAVAVALLGLVLFGWSWLTPFGNATWLNRSVVLMVEASTLMALCGLVLQKIQSIHDGWAKSIGSAIPAVVAVGSLALLFCLSTEVWYQLNFGSVLINPVSQFAIGATLVAAIVVQIWFALSPSHDPLHLSESGRMKYVYGAEVLLALLFLHIRLTMPWLFQGFFERYWPFVVMTIAYLGVVLSDLLRRRDVLVLARPIERTGAFLPMLPVVGFWIASSEVDYSTLLFVVGGLYGLLSSLRRSVAFGLLAAVAGHAGFWYILQRTENYQFLQHPQLWLVPVAFSVLVAAYLNEESLSDDHMAALRYLSLLMIYASSTADIFINGVANSPWLPLILGGFALAGVFSGIMFKIRGMLLLGSVFLLLSITTMIWYASVNFGWTWLWYVAGIATGASIIFMFAIFEKKRSEVLRVVEGFKEWEL